MLPVTEQKSRISIGKQNEFPIKQKIDFNSTINPELLIHILSFLSGKDIAQVGSLNRYLREAINEIPQNNSLAALVFFSRISPAAERNFLTSYGQLPVVLLHIQRYKEARSPENPALFDRKISSSLRSLKGISELAEFTENQSKYAVFKDSDIDFYDCTINNYIRHHAFNVIDQETLKIGNQKKSESLVALHLITVIGLSIAGNILIKEESTLAKAVFTIISMSSGSRYLKLPFSEILSSTKKSLRSTFQYFCSQNTNQDPSAV